MAKQIKNILDKNICHFLYVSWIKKNIVLYRYKRLLLMYNIGEHEIITHGKKNTDYTHTHVIQTFIRCYFFFFFLSNIRSIKNLQNKVRFEL